LLFAWWNQEQPVSKANSPSVTMILFIGAPSIEDSVVYFNFHPNHRKSSAKPV
jgi:hypothetical protein